MKKLTIAERNEQRQVELDKALKLAIQEYPDRLMKVMAGFSDIDDFAVALHNESPLRFKFNTRYSEVVIGSVLESWDQYYDLEMLEHQVQAHHEAKKEAERKYDVLVAARDKLYTMFNDEERNLLGL